MSNFVNRHIKWVFSLPVLIFMVATIVTPIAMTFLFSPNDQNLLMGNGMHFNWGKNYLDVLTSREFWQSLGIIFYYTVIAMVAEMFLGLTIVLVLNKDFWGKNGVKTVMLLPHMMVLVVVGLTWMLFYELSFGPLNYVFTTVGLPRSAFASAKQTVIPAIVTVEAWQMTSMVVIVRLVGLSSLPTGPMEAARVDGVTPIQTFFQVTLPLLTQTLFSIGLLRFIDVFKSFDLIYAMTRGESANVSRALNLFTYETVSSYYKFGLSSTVLIILSMIVPLLSILVVKIQRKLVAYYGD